MKLVITEKQYKSLLREDFNSMKSKISFFKRRISGMNQHIHEIVIEGLDYANPCNYDNFNFFMDEIISSSALTFIYSYEELYLPWNEEFVKLMNDYIHKKYKNFLLKEWNEKECD